MRIRIVRTVGKKDTVPRSPDHPKSLELPAKPDGTMFQEGEILNLSDEQGEKLIRAGVGEPVDAQVKGGRPQPTPPQHDEPKPPEPKAPEKK